MPKTIAQNQQIRDATRAKLLASAMTIFATQGYGSTSIRKIATQAKVSPGLFYHYFDSKEALLQAVCLNTFAMIDASMANVALIPAPLDRINFLVRTIFNMLQADPAFWALFYSLRTQPVVMTIVGELFLEKTQFLRNCFIGFLREAGHKTPEIDAHVLYSLIEGTIQQYLLEPKNYPLDAVVIRILDLYEA